MDDVLLAVGTRKGLFLGRRSGGDAWDFTGPHFPMQAVYSIGIDTRRARPRVLVGADSSHWGPSVFRSDDLGRTWLEPARPAVRFPEGTDTSLERVWQLHPAEPTDPEVVWAGTQPGALFRSEDGGETFSFVRNLWEHPQRPQWGAGFGGQAVHTVVTDPRDPGAVMVGVSSGGVYRSEDGGESWAPSNSGLKADFLPDPYPEFGQCVHKIARDPAAPERLYLQNHGGVYRSDDGGAHWSETGKGLPAGFGFAVATHPQRGGVAYVFPVVDGSDRYPPDYRCRVYRTGDGGSTWDELCAGLPDEPHYGVVLRDALRTDDADPAGVYFGNRNGEVYASADEGESWRQIARHLPDVLCVRAAVIG
ncbi:exo-alpha-sialidase [Streptomyces sp. NPDC005271]|uniref:WD40/YVTN/BNR-like repeat-containing protein n=1 Tax=unclassified Streptomyces TaxID=2593676 RepID=UPI0033A9B2A4